MIKAQYSVQFVNSKCTLYIAHLDFSTICDNVLVFWQTRDSSAVVAPVVLGAVLKQLEQKKEASKTIEKTQEETREKSGRAATWPGWLHCKIFFTQKHLVFINVYTLLNKYVDF